MANKNDLNRTQKLTDLNTALDWVGMSNAFWMEGDNSAYWNTSLQGGAGGRELQNEISYLKRAKKELENDLALERSRSTLSESDRNKSLRKEIDEKKERIQNLEKSVSDTVKVWDKSKQALNDIHFVLGTSSLQDIVIAMEGKSLKELAKRAKEGKTAGEDWSDISMQFNRPEIKEAWTKLGITYKDAYVWVRGGLIGYNDHKFVHWATQVKNPPIDAFEYVRSLGEQKKEWWIESKLVTALKPIAQTGRIVINNPTSHFFTDNGKDDRTLTLNLNSPIEYADFDERLAFASDEKWKKPQQVVLWYIDDKVKRKDLFDQLKAKIPSGKKISKLTLNVTKVLGENSNLNIEYSPPITSHPFASINIWGDIYTPIVDADLVLVNEVPSGGWKLWNYTNPSFDSEERVKAWENKGFNLDQAQKWIIVGLLKVDESAFARWLTDKGGKYAEPKWISTNRGTVEAEWKQETEESGSITLSNGFNEVTHDNGTKRITLKYNGLATEVLTVGGLKAKEKAPSDKLKNTTQLVINLTGASQERYEKLRNKFLLALKGSPLKIELIKGSTIDAKVADLIITQDSFKDEGVAVERKGIATYLNSLYNDLQPYLTTGVGVGGKDEEWNLVNDLLGEYTSGEVQIAVGSLVARLDTEKDSYTTSGKFNEIRNRLSKLIGAGSTERTWIGLTERIVPVVETDITMKNPPISMSACGTADDFSAELFNLPPRGSAIMTGAGGGLTAEGFTNIVNPLSGSNSDLSKRPSMPTLIKSIQNTILLLERTNKPNIAFPLIGGDLFLNSFNDLTGTTEAKRQEIAEAIIISAIKQRTRNSLVLKFLDHADNSFVTAWNKIKADPKYAGMITNVEALPADTTKVGEKTGLTRFGHHNCRVIANAPNFECQLASGGGVVAGIRNVAGATAVTWMDKEASDTITEYWKRFKEKTPSSDEVVLTLAQKQENLIKLVRAILKDHTSGITNPEVGFNEKGRGDSHWGNATRGDTWDKYLATATKDDDSSDADTNFKGIKFAILQTLAEYIINKHIDKNQKAPLQAFIDACREPEMVDLYTRDDYKTTLTNFGIKTFVEVTDWTNVLNQIDTYLYPKKTGSLEEVRKWVLEKRWPDPLEGIDLKGAELTKLRTLKKGTSSTYINDNAKKSANRWKGYTALDSFPDGNCFLNSFAILLTGEDSEASQIATSIRLRIALCLELMKNGTQYFGDYGRMHARMIENADDDTKTPWHAKMATTMTRDKQWLSTDDIVPFTKILKRPLIAVFNDSSFPASSSWKTPDTGGISNFEFGIQDQKGIRYRYQPFVVYNSNATHFEALVLNEIHNEGYVEFTCKNVTFEDEKNEADNKSILIETQGSPSKFGFSVANDKKLTDGKWDDWRAIRIWYNGKDDKATKDSGFKVIKNLFTDGVGAFNKKGDTFAFTVINAGNVRFDDNEIHIGYDDFVGMTFVNK
jgi:hypothetical protein